MQGPSYPRSPFHFRWDAFNGISSVINSLLHSRYKNSYFISRIETELNKPGWHPSGQITITQEHRHQQTTAPGIVKYPGIDSDRRMNRGVCLNGMQLNFIISQHQLYSPLITSTTGLSICIGVWINTDYSSQ